MAQPSSFRHHGCSNRQNEKFRRYIVNKDTLIGLSCTECFSEWTLSDFLLEGQQGSEVMTIEGKIFHLIEKQKEDEYTFSFKYTQIKDLDDLSYHLTPGDHITYQWLAGFRHHAIVRGTRRKDHGPDEITLIHWQDGQGKGVPKLQARVIEETIDNMRTKASVIYKCEYSEDSVREDNRFLTLARADAWVGESGYDLTEKNCEHFAVFCKTGHHRSFQSELVTKVVSEVVRCVIKYTDETVENIKDLSIGDHIVMYMWLLHPRCHMIVTGVDDVDGKIEVIRFTYMRGVVEEKLNFRKPIYKVICENTFGPGEVIKRARYPIKMYYNINNFNCKHFAFWCKTDMIPPPETFF